MNRPALPPKIGNLRKSGAVLAQQMPRSPVPPASEEAPQGAPETPTRGR